MGKTRENFYVAEAATSRGVLCGLQWLATWGDVSRAGVIVVPTKQQFRGGDLAAAIGDQAVRALGQGKSVSLGRAGRGVRGYTQKTLPRFETLGPTLALWPGKDELDALHDCRSVALCVVPWVMDHVALWSAAVGAVNVLNNSAAVLAKVSDPVVDRALISLTHRVNLSTGISHPRDKDAAVGMFRILEKGGHRWMGDEIMARALQLSWRASDARELAELAAGMSVGRRYQAPGAKEAWAKDILQRWRESASG